MATQSTTAFPPIADVAYAMKATFNSTSQKGRLFVNGQEVGLDIHKSRSDAESVAATDSLALATDMVPVYFGATCVEFISHPTSCSNFFHGAIEEVYLKNTSTENRHAYVGNVLSVVDFHIWSNGMHEDVRVFFRFFLVCLLFY